MDRLGRVVGMFWEAVDGLKTLGVAVVFFLLGLAEYTDTVDIRPLLHMFIGDDERVSKIMMLMPLIFGTLRFMTKDKPKWLRRREEAEDECNQSKEH
jgi:hypothetical protein